MTQESHQLTKAELEIKLEGDRIKKSVESCNRVLEAFFWHLNKHKLSQFDSLVALSGAFKSIQKSLPTLDDQTQFELLFISMIENKYEQPEKPGAQ